MNLITTVAMRGRLTDYATSGRKNVHYAFIAGVNVHEHGITVVIIIAAFLAGKERKDAGIWR